MNNRMLPIIVANKNLSFHSSFLSFKRKARLLIFTNVIIRKSTKRGHLMLEVIATCLEDVKRIESAGGKRIELISSYTEGGLTPSYAFIKKR